MCQHGDKEGELADTGGDDLVNVVIWMLFNLFASTCSWHHLMLQGGVHLSKSRSRRMSLSLSTVERCVEITHTPLIALTALQAIFLLFWFMHCVLCLRVFSLFPRMKQTGGAESMTSTCPAFCSTWTTVLIHSCCHVELLLCHLLSFWPCLLLVLWCVFINWKKTMLNTGENKVWNA